MKKVNFYTKSERVISSIITVSTFAAIIVGFSLSFTTISHAIPITESEIRTFADTHDVQWATSGNKYEYRNCWFWCSGSKWNRSAANVDHTDNSDIWIDEYDYAKLYFDTPVSIGPGSILGIVGMNNTNPKNKLNLKINNTFIDSFLHVDSLLINLDDYASFDDSTINSIRIQHGKNSWGWMYDLDSVFIYTPTNDVPAPAPLALMLIGSLGLLRKKFS